MTTMSSPVRFGVIGAGALAMNQHIPNLMRTHHAVLHAVCDLNKQRLDLVSDKYDVGYTTTDYQQLLDDPSIDVILIATAADGHLSLTLEALSAGKHVYVEKPLAETADECAQVIQAQKQADRHVAIGFNRRMAPALRLAKDIANHHGGVKHIHYRVSDAYWSWGAHYPKRTRIVHEVCHMFDLVRYLTGSNPNTVYCMEARADDETVCIRFDSGCVASIMSSGYATVDMPKESMDMMVELGSVIMTDFVELRTFGLEGYESVYRFAGHTHPDRDHVHRSLFAKQGAGALLDIRRAYYEAGLQETPENKHYLEHHAPLINYMVNKGWLEAVDHFAWSIQQGHQPETASPVDAWWAAQITEAVMQSRETGMPVALSDLPPIVSSVSSDQLLGQVK
jgi:predicted dehydrogenase